MPGNVFVDLTSEVIKKVPTGNASGTLSLVPYSIIIIIKRKPPKGNHKSNKSKKTAKTKKKKTLTITK